MTCKVRNLLAAVWNAPQAISNNSKRTKNYIFGV